MSNDTMTTAAPMPSIYERNDPVPPELVEQIEAEHQASIAALEESAVRGYRAGQLLIEAKRHVGHGDWRTYVDEHFSFDIRMAQIYMRVARHWEEGANAQHVAHLGIRGVNDFICQWIQERNEKREQQGDPHDEDGEFGKVSRSKLLAAVKSVSPAVPRKDVLEQTDCLFFYDGIVAATNSELVCSAPCELPVSFTGAIHAKTMLEFLELRDCEDLELSVVDGGLQFIWGEDNKQTWFEGTGLLEEHQQVLEEIGSLSEWRSLHPDFSEAVSAVAPYISRSCIEPNRIFVHVYPNYVEVAGEDDARRYDISTGFEQSFMVMARHTFQHITGREMTEGSFGVKWVHFRDSAGVTYSLRHYPDQPLGRDHFFDVQGGHPVVFPSGIAEPLELVRRLKGLDMPRWKVFVSLTFSRENCRVWDVAELVDYAEDLRCNYDGPARTYTLSLPTWENLLKLGGTPYLGDNFLHVVNGALKYTLMTPATDEVEEFEPRWMLEETVMNLIHGILEDQDDDKLAELRSLGVTGLKHRLLDDGSSNDVG